MNSSQIRQLRTQFRESKQHKLLKPVSLIAPAEDKTVMFNVAGMQQLVPYLSGKPHPLGKRLFNIQNCVRTIDIEEIGDERHLSMFEMMGHRSLGDYFKKEVIERTIEFLTQYLNLPIEKIGYGIFGGYTKNNGEIEIPFDQVAYDALIQNGIDPKHIKAIPMFEGKKCDNFWGPAGAIGPCGPSAEPHFDRGEKFGPADRDIGKNDRYIEIGNNVFMEFYKEENGEFSKLPQHNVDTGMGFERLVMVMQQTDTIFETDLFTPIIKAIEAYSTEPYIAFTKKEYLLTEAEQQIIKSYRIIADHMRSITMLIAEGVSPSNEGRGYVVRRLIRRMYFHFTKITKDIQNFDTFLQQTLQALTDTYGETYPQISENNNIIYQKLNKEVKVFQKTLLKGEQQLNKIIEKSTNHQIRGEDVFLLYDTFGFPIDLTQEIAENRGLSIDEQGFNKAMGKAKKLSQQGANKKFNRGVDRAKYLEGIPPTQFIGYNQLTADNPTILKQFQLEDGQNIIIFDQTPFYAESGGQKGDSGIMEIDENTILSITNVIKYDGVYLHFIRS